jgi:hypothetical protein
LISRRVDEGAGRGLDKRKRKTKQKKDKTRIEIERCHQIQGYKSLVGHGRSGQTVKKEKIEVECCSKFPSVQIPILPL